MTGGQRGAVSLLAIAVVVLAACLALGVARLGHVASDKARAESAADAAALAAAGALVRGASSAAAGVAAAASAGENGARLLRCACAGDDATVEVELGIARAHARAEVRFECLADPEAC